MRCLSTLQPTAPSAASLLMRLVCLLRQAARHARTISQVSTSLFLQGWSARISFALTKAVASTTLRRMHILQAHHAAANGVALPYGAADFLAPDGGGDGGNGGLGWGCGGGAG